MPCRAAAGKEESAVTETRKPSEKLLLDREEGRYTLVHLVREWTDILQYSDEAKEWNQSELIKRAMEDVMSGRITEEDVRKAKAKSKPVHVEEEKTADEDLKSLKSKKNEKEKK